jgi:hypothetical protein
MITAPVNTSMPQALMIIGEFVTGQLFPIRSVRRAYRLITSTDRECALLTVPGVSDSIAQVGGVRVPPFWRFLAVAESRFWAMVVPKGPLAAWFGERIL